MPRPYWELLTLFPYFITLPSLLRGLKKATTNEKLKTAFPYLLTLIYSNLTRSSTVETNTSNTEIRAVSLPQNSYSCPLPDPTLLKKQALLRVTVHLIVMFLATSITPPKLPVHPEILKSNLEKVSQTQKLPSFRVLSLNTATYPML